MNAPGLEIKSIYKLNTKAVDNEVNTTNTNNITISDFSKEKVRNASKIKLKGKSPLKFPIPKIYKQNDYPDKITNPLDLTREMIQYYDQKDTPERYNRFVEETLNNKKKEKSKKEKNSNKNKKIKEEKTPFENVSTYTFVLSNSVKLPNRSKNFLPYLNIGLGAGSDQIQLMSLKDSGASHTILEVEEFKKIPNHEHIEVHIKEYEMITPNHSSKNTIEGSVELELQIEDVTGEVFEITHTFLLAHLNGKQKCIIGNDFLSDETFVVGSTPRHLYLKQRNHNFAVRIHKGNETKEEATPQLSALNTLELKPNTESVITIVCESEFKEITDYENQNCLVQPIRLQEHHGLVMQPAMVLPEKLNDNMIKMRVTIMNLSLDEITLQQGTIVGNLEEIPSDAEKITLSQEDFDSLSQAVNLSENADKLIDINHIEFSECTDNKGEPIYTYNIVETNTMFNNLQDHEEITELPDGSQRTQLTTDVEELLECETSIKPEELEKQDTFEISMADTSSVPEHLKDKLNHIITNEFGAVWSKHKYDIGVTNKIKHHVETIPGKVVKDKKRPIPYPRLEFARKAVDTLAKYKLVSPILNSKWGSNLVLVQKPITGLRDTTKASQVYNRGNTENKCTWRLTQDLKGLNKITLNTYNTQLPSVDDIVALSKDKVVTSLDINNAYFVIPLTEESKSKTSFYVDDHIYMWDRMTQGLCGAPHTWTKLMHIIFSDEAMKEYKAKFPEYGKTLGSQQWKDFLVIYMDDIYIISKTYEINLIHTHAVLWVLHKEGILLNPKKASFCKTVFSCLGITINTKENLVSIDKKRAAAILEWPKPATLIEVMSRLQSLNYLGKHLPHLKTIAYPLITMIRTKIFCWEEEHETAWTHLKHLITLNIRLSIPNPDLELVGSSDTSKIAVAGCLWNWDRAQNKLYLIGCMSKLLSVTDSYKPPFYKECLALCLNLKYFECYILGSKFMMTCLCDARGIMYLHRNKEHSSRLTTISLYLSQFNNLRIWHIPGNQNQLSDIFSRSYHGSQQNFKDDFKLSKTQANNLPPLPENCLLDPDTLFRIFSSLPEPEPDHDRGKRQRRKLPMPKPLNHILKDIDSVTPEERFMAAKRVLLGWNDKPEEIQALINTVDITTVKTDFLKLQKRVDITYLEALKCQLNTELQDDYTRYLKDRASRAIYEMKYNIESQKDITLVKDIRAVLPEPKVKSAMQAMRQVFTDSVIDKVYTCSFELDPKLPKITLPSDPQERTKSLSSLNITPDEQDFPQEEKLVEEIITIMSLEVIPEEREPITLNQERLTAVFSDILSNNGKLSQETMTKLQRNDETLMRTISQIENGHTLPNFAIVNDILIKIETDKWRKKRVAKICIPQGLMATLCNTIHTKSTEHQPITSSLVQFNKHFYNKQAKAIMKKITDNCILCKFTEKPSGVAAPGPGQERTLKLKNLRPREAIALDLAVSLPTTEDGNSHALAIIDIKTNYCQVYPLKSKRASEVAEKLLLWIQHMMPPKHLYQDLGTEFQGEVLEVCKKFNITHHTTFPDNHEGNKAELAIKAFKNNARKYIFDYHNTSKATDWDKILPILLPKINNSILNKTKTITRELLMFGDEMAQPSLDLIEGEEKDYFIAKDEEKENCLLEYDNFRRNNKKYYKNPPYNNLRKGDLIWILNRKDQYPKSLRIPYTGPYRITQMYAMGATSQHVVNGQVLSAHYKHIKKLTLQEFQDALPSSWVSDIQTLIISSQKRAHKSKNLDIIFEEANP